MKGGNGKGAPGGRSIARRARSDIGTEKVVEFPTRGRKTTKKFMSKRGKAAKLLPLHDDDLNAAIARDEAELAAILDPSKLEKILNMDFEADE